MLWWQEREKILMTFMESSMLLIEDVDSTRKGSCRLRAGGWIFHSYLPDNRIARNDGRVWGHFKGLVHFRSRLRYYRLFRHFWKLPLVSVLPSIVFFKKLMNGTFSFETRSTVERPKECFLRMDLCTRPKAGYLGPFWMWHPIVPSTEEEKRCFAALLNCFLFCNNNGNH